VRSVVAYRTVGVPVTERIAHDVETGRINAILVTSGSVAEQVRLQFPDIPASTIVAAIGPRTAKDARKAGLGVNAIAREQTVDGLIAAVQRFPCRTRPTSSRSDGLPHPVEIGSLPVHPPRGMRALAD
jgi:uroporphyrinogen-III synthase